MPYEIVPRKRSGRSPSSRPSTGDSGWAAAVTSTAPANEWRNNPPSNKSFERRPSIVNHDHAIPMAATQPAVSMAIRAGRLIASPRPATSMAARQPTRIDAARVSEPS
jgi:hypothetical protein